MVVMGHVIGPFGIHGQIKINPYTEYIDGLMDYPTWWLGKSDDQWQEAQVDDVRISGNVLTVKLKGFDDRTQAEKLKGLLVAIPRDQLPDLPENGTDGYYWSDLIDTEVVNLAGEKLGTVTGLLETGANDVLCIKRAANETNEILIPFIEQFVIKVDLKQSQIVVDWETDY